ncbi:MAG: DUF692 family protein, partial [Chryseobacterium sp.]
LYFSLFSGKWLPEHSQWLAKLKETCTRFRFDHVTEHFGFMTGQDFHHGAPLNVPYSATTLRIGQDRLKRLSNICNCPVGLENLAFSYSVEEVKQHGFFLEELLDPVNGFLILDLHNLYCQLHNFSVSADEMFALYPLDKVREIHISGGSWESSIVEPGRAVRRDTHDDAVPEEVFQLLKKALPNCANLKYVVLEQLGNGLNTPESRQQFYTDFGKMEKIIANENKSPRDAEQYNFLPPQFSLSTQPAEDITLYNQQLELSFILESSQTFDEVMNHLENSSLANSDWQLEKWQPYMIETAMQIAQKWKREGSGVKRQA